jgi:hypothetical protein
LGSWSIVSFVNSFFRRFLLYVLLFFRYMFLLEFSFVDTFIV